MPKQGNFWTALSAALCLLPVPAGAGPAEVVGPAGSTLFEAIRNGNAARVRALSVRRPDVNRANAEGETPLHYAALYGDVKTVELLLGRGADGNCKSAAGATPLMFAVGDIAKVRVLVEHGADVNARSATGRSALLMAASRAGSGAVVRYLLEHGAEIDVKDKLSGVPLIPAGGGGSTPLIEAAKIRDGQALRLLMERGANLQEKDNSGADALAAAALNGNLANVRVLLAHGARVDSRVALGQLTPLIFAAWRQDPQMAKALLDGGADVNAQDATGATALMWSAYSDYADPATTEVLLAAGADVRHRNRAGESAFTWARRRGDTAVSRLLLAKGAEAEPAGTESRSEPVAAPAGVQEAVRKSVAALQAGGPPFLKVSGCVSCHNQSLPQMAVAMARSHAIPVDETVVEQQRKAVLANLRPARQVLLEMSDVVPDVPGTAGYLMLGLAAENYAADSVTDAVALHLAGKQFADGSWRPWAPRPPLEFSPVSSTALAVRVLRLYGPPAMRAEMEQRIAAARRFLEAVDARTNEEKVMRVLGLAWAGAPQAKVAEAAKVVAAGQRTDGGWAQLPSLESDAYATGQALYALHQAGVAPDDAARRRGADYLLRTQLADGTWHVVSRAFPFQPYKESGYPHGKDQWISSAGASWATLALLQQMK